MLREMAEKYMQPFVDLFDQWLIKGLTSLIVAIFHTSAELPAIVCILFLLDFFSGVRNSRQRGEKITAKRMQNAFRKATDYIIFILAVTAFSKLHEMLTITVTVAYIFVALTYLKSIAENVSGYKSGDNHPVAKIMTKLKEINPFGFFDSEDEKSG